MGILKNDWSGPGNGVALTQGSGGNTANGTNNFIDLASSPAPTGNNTRGPGSFHCIDCAATAGQQSLIRYSTSLVADKQFAFSFPIYIPSTPAAVTNILFAGNGGTRVFQIAIDVSRDIVVQNQAATTVKSFNPLTVSTWYWVIGFGTVGTSSSTGQITVAYYAQTTIPVYGTDTPVETPYTATNLDFSTLTISRVEAGKQSASGALTPSLGPFAFGTATQDVNSLWALNVTKNLSDNVGITDTVTPNVHVFKNIIDGVGITDTGSPYSLLFEYVSSQSDSEGITDTISTKTIYSRSQSDSEGITDSISSKITKNLSIDAEGITDSIIVHPSRGLSNPVGITDTLSHTSTTKKAVSNPVGISDTITTIVVPHNYVNLSESLGITDSVIAGYNRPPPPQLSAKTLSDLEYSAYDGFQNPTDSIIDRLAEEVFTELQEDGYGASVQEDWDSSDATKAVSQVLRENFGAAANESVADAMYRYYNAPAG